MTLLLASHLILSAAFQAPPASQITFCKLNTPKAYHGQSGAITAIQIQRLGSLREFDATIIYMEGTVSVNEGGVYTAFNSINGEELPFVWNDSTFTTQANSMPSAGLTRLQDLMAQFYGALAGSRSEYACQLIPKNQ